LVPASFQFPREPKFQKCWFLIFHRIFERRKLSFCRSRRFFIHGIPAPPHPERSSRSSLIPPLSVRRPSERLFLRCAVCELCFFFFFASFPVADFLFSRPHAGPFPNILFHLPVHASLEPCPLFHRLREALPPPFRRGPALPRRFFSMPFSPQQTCPPRKTLVRF